MNTKDVIELASRYLQTLPGHEFDVLEVAKPVSPDAALNLAKIISKLSPLLGNLIEFNTCEFLNDQKGFGNYGRWARQDPGFPDMIFSGSISPTPGFEIKAWFPLATEITARFKDSQNHFIEDHTHVAMLAWLPEFLIYGKPKIVDIAIFSAESVAKARDTHYHNPPDYLVLEPGDTSQRTSNLQQTNTNGYKFQGTIAQFQEATALVASWGRAYSAYQPTVSYQQLLRQLVERYPYRLDTNFAKMDRIRHLGIEAFKQRVYATRIHGRTVLEWNRLFSLGTEIQIREVLARTFAIHEDERPVVV